MPRPQQVRPLEFEYKLVVVVREDIKLSAGKLAVQVAHAAVSCAVSSRRDRTRWYRAWFDEGQRKVVLRAFDLEHLRELEAKARRAGLTAEKVQDAGLTEIPPGTVTCVGIGPAPSNKIDPVTGSLPLWK